MAVDKTMSFKVEKDKSLRAKEILKEVYQALVEKGYNPINQIVGYILSGDPTYITSHNDARNLIRMIERDELLENFGIVKCSEEDFKKFDKKDYVKFKRNRYEYDILVEDKVEFARKYDAQIIDKPTIEDIMLIYIKGEK